MNTTTTILVLLAIVGAIAFSYMRLRKKRKEEREEFEIMLPMLTTEENEIKLAAFEIIGAEKPSFKRNEPFVYPVRDVNEHIDLLGSTWVAYRSGDQKPTNKKRGYGGIYSYQHNTLFINCDNWGMDHFINVVVHEALHAAGYEHGKVMETRQKEIVIQIRNQGHLV